MACERRIPLGCTMARGIAISFFCAAFLGIDGLGAEPAVFDPRTASDQEAAAFASASLDGGAAPDTADVLAFLAINRPQIVIPELRRRLASPEEGKEAAKAKHRIADLLAYAANSEALEALSDLMNRDPSRYAYFVERLLDYSASRRNPFELAYDALQFNNPALERGVAAWIERRTLHPRSISEWLQALTRRNGGNIDQNIVAADPLLHSLPRDLALRSREALLRASTTGAPAPRR